MEVWPGRRIPPPECHAEYPSLSRKRLASDDRSGDRGKGHPAQNFALLIDRLVQGSIEYLIGQLKAGYFADVIAGPGNPLEDITAVERVSFVMKGGTVVRP